MGAFVNDNIMVTTGAFVAEDDHTAVEAAPAPQQLPGQQRTAARTRSRTCPRSRCGPT